MKTLSALLSHGAARNPSAPAVTDGLGTIIWARFEAKVGGVAAQLLRAGVRPGDAVALWMPNSADYLATIFACARVSALAVHVNTRFRSAEVGSLLRRSRAGVLVTEWGFPPVDFPGVLASVPEQDRAGLRLVIGRHLPPDTSTVLGLPAHSLGSDGDTEDTGRPETPCLTFTTSGSTSGPKLVVHDQRGIAEHAGAVAEATRLDQPGSALLAAVPFCGTFGNVAAMAAVAGGAHVVCMDRFDAAPAIDLIRQHRISHVIGGDDMLARMVETAQGERFTTIKLFAFAAFHSDALTTAKAAAAIGLEPSGVYGSSEVQALFAIGQGADRLLGGGKPVNSRVKVSVRDPETGAVLPPGQSGELCFKAPSRFVGYLGDEAALARATTADGFFRSGDLGRLAGDSFVYEARLGDALRLGGFLVKPEEIESFLGSLPGVAGAQVVAAKQGRELVPVAFVTARPGAALEEAMLIAHCRETIARFKVPARIRVMHAFPTIDSPNGAKIHRSRLREMADDMMQQTAP